MRHFAILAITFLIASMAIVGGEAGYKRLNDYLIEKVDNDNVASNMEAALKWLKEQDSTKHSFLSGVPISDLKKFTALQQVVDDTKCDHSSYDIIRANERAVGLHYLSDNKRVIRRVDKVMYDIFKNHAMKCPEVYQATYRIKKQQLDEEVFKRVTKVGKALIKSNTWTPYKHSTSLYRGYIKDYPSFKDFPSYEIYEALLSSAKYDPDIKYARKVPDERTGRDTIHKDKIKVLVKNYIIEPCQHYITEMGLDLFIPARFDSRIYIELDDNDDYYLGWSYFMICQELTSKKVDVFNAIIDSVED